MPRPAEAEPQAVASDASRLPEHARECARGGDAHAASEHGLSGHGRPRIRSFVLRTGRLTDAQQRAMDELWPRYGLEFTGQARDWDVAFGRAAPLVVEIGFGNGEALATSAAADPVRNYLGLEVHTPGVGRLLRSVAAAALRNVRVLRHDAVAVLDDEIPNGGIAELRIWFPDPWPKKRHHKRRLIQPEFLARIRPKLAIGGVLHLATDWQPYAEHMLECLSAAPGYANTVTAGYAPRPESRPLTHFEQRGQRLGHGVWDLLWRRVG